MRQLKLAIVALFMLVTVSNVSAQDKNNPWVVGFGINTVDVRVYDKGFGDIMDDYFNTSEWGGNTLPSISRITVDRYLSNGFGVQLAGAVNKLSTVEVKDDADALFIAIDALAKYDLNYLFGETGWFDPYVSVGLGYQDLDHEQPAFRNSLSGKSDFMYMGNLGFNTWFNDNLGLNFQTGYSHNFKNSGFDVFKHSVSLVVKFGGNDTDGDGVYDKYDACPEIPGLAEFNGCPDSDGDGVIDSEDACPEVPGLAIMNGCPDTDGDGIADKDDACPEAKGTKANNGCPDTDGDGVVDKDDLCPEAKGTKENKGCPDTDGDGVLDKDDNCPQVAGLKDNNGCPEDYKELREALAKNNVLFATDRANISKESAKILDVVYDLITPTKNVIFVIEGHTDSRASDAYNLYLSERRTESVKAYLVKKGFDADRLETKGYGEKEPVATNKTRAGRKLNRRVVIKLTDK
ncbi:OmpA family protein [Polaribacter sargassicola]|uniref:OmpA family protein n=1 Tax=Polaribacter sargassicola TaxID=2836891 RepID=UPI001F255C08|nr:OmpA family protein [Polaribacter sp. DS7-9]MCG1035372.1 OmpA family protein [Polaribacter sp. DS7-9]